MSQRLDSPFPPQTPALRPTMMALLVTAIATVLSYNLPEQYSATGVGGCFCLATYFLVLRRSNDTIEHFGLAMAGIFQPIALDAQRILRSLGTSLGWTAIASILILGPFVVLYPVIWAPGHNFQLPPAPLLDDVLGQLLVIAIPEEMFYRGYLQTAFDDAFRTRFRFLGTRLGLGVLLSSLVFALGHLATRTQPERLAVFFPSLAFGWLRARTGGVGAPAMFHAACNLTASYLAAGYFGR